MIRPLLVLLAIVALAVGVNRLQPVHKPVRTPINSIVRLHFGPTGRFFCSGTVISPTVVLTAAHCVMAAIADLGPLGIIPIPITVKTADGKVLDMAAIPARAEERGDNGLIFGHFESVAPAKTLQEPNANISAFQSGHLMACGFPFGAPLFCVRVTNLSPFNFQWSGDSHLWGGMSGGPVYDMDTGLIVGVNSAVEGAKVLITTIIDLDYALGLRE